MNTAEAYNALNLLPKIGPVRVRRLLTIFGTPQAILGAKREQIRQLEGFGNEMAKLIVSWQDRIDLQRELQLIRDANVHCVCPADDDYPTSLRDIHDPPLVLYVWGTLTAADNRSIGIVGSRRATHYGQQTAKKL